MARCTCLGDSWRTYVRGEWWIDLDGEPVFADQDIGEAGHEKIAADSMLDLEVLVAGLLEEGLLTEEEADDYLEGDYGAAALFFTKNIPDEIGIAAARSEERWRDLKKDVRMAYAKHEGAILAINTEFFAWEVTAKTIKAIQSFIEGEVYEQGANISTLEDSDICVEEASTKRYACLPASEFLLVKYPRQLFGNPCQQCFPW